MVLFALTGLTLNHAGQIEGRPVTVAKDGTLPPQLVARLKDSPAVSKDAVPQDVRDWLSNTLRVNVAGRDTEWSAREIYVALPRPGGDAWLTIDRANGASSYEAHRSRLDRLPQRPAQGPPHRLRLELVHRHLRRRLRRVLRHRAVVAAASCRQAAGHLAGRRHGLGDPGAALLSSFSSISECFSMRLTFTAAVTSLVATHAVAGDATISIDIPRLTVAEYHTPYVAFWIESADGDKISNLAVWYDIKLKDNEGNKVAEGHAPVVAPHRPRPDVARRWPHQPHPRAGHA